MKRRFKQATAVVLALAIGVGALGFGYAAWLFTQLPPLTTLKNYEPALITSVYDRRGKLVTELAEERRTIVPLEQYPEHLIHAFLSAEDNNFFDHFGIEPVAIVRAIVVNIMAGRKKQGASTITQQVARSFFLTHEKTYTRKIKEIFLALKLELFLSKEEILFLYLNQIYLGRGAYGVGAAADMYFGKQPNELTVPESAILAGLPQRPSDYAPHTSPGQARGRQRYVIEQMVQNGWLSKEDAVAALATPVPIVRWESPFWQAPHAAEEVRRWLLERFPEDAVMRGGLHVYTTIDLEATRAAHKAVESGLENLDKRQGYRGPVTSLARAQWDGWLERQRAEMTTELIAALQGDVQTYVGPALDEPGDPGPAVTAPAGAAATGTAAPRPVTTLSGPVTAAIPDDMIFSGLVTGYSREQNVAWVHFGLGVGRLPGAGMFWAREVNPEVPAGRKLIENPMDRLAVGDVIRVRRYWIHPDPEFYTRRMALPHNTAERKKNKAKELAGFSESGPGSMILALEQRPKAQAALVSVLPGSGEIIAMVGGYDYAESQFNRATQAKRQPGSAFKPIVYSAALEGEFTPASILVDTPLVYRDVTRETSWKPKNYEERFYGPMTLVDALTKSRNVVTIQLVRKLGIPVIMDQARELGIESKMPDDLSMALGSGVVAPVELVRPYATFVNGGRRPEISLVREVWDATGKPVYQYMPPVSEAMPIPYSPYELAPPPVASDVPFGLRDVAPVASPELDEFPQVVTPEVAYQMTYLLRNVVERGTGWRARALGRPTAGKTGTTDDNIDSWFAGFTNDLATVVWVGFDQLQPLGAYETGSRAASPIWVDYMKAAHAGIPASDFPIPGDIVFRRIDAEKGTLASPLSKQVLTMPFAAGTEPDAVRKAGEEAEAGEGHRLFEQKDYLHRTGDW